jgi:peptide/nickel transport system permease protein
LGPIIVRRIVVTIPLLLLVSFGVFSLSILLPSDPAVVAAGGVNATEEAIEQKRHELGLDEPFLEQYRHWLADAVRLDFGESWISGRSVSSDIWDKLPITASIAGAAVLVGLGIGVPAGILAGTRPGSLVDKASVVLATIGVAIPNFWLALMLVVLFAAHLDWFPVLGYVGPGESVTGWIRHLVLPAIALGVLVAASLARQLRAGLVDVLGSNYVRTAWAKGGTRFSVVGRHALKNAAIPAVTILGLQLGGLLGGAVIIENIFGIPGVGTLMVRGLSNSDVPVIQGVVLVYVLAHVLVNLAVDLVYTVLNPKIVIS